MKQSNNNRRITSTTAIQTDWRTIAVVLICGLALAAGFFFAARQHFLSMDLGFKSSKLRKQLDDLESEKRRLLLAREVSLSPMELKKVSRAARAANESRPVAQQIAFNTTQADPTSVAATVQLKQATALLAKKPRTARIEHSGDIAMSERSNSPRGIELAAAINLR